MQILRIRYFQLRRDLGFLFFLILPALSLLSYFLYQSSQNIGLYVTGVILYLVYNFHASRRDLAFVYKHFDKALRQIIMEYQLFLLPVTLPALFTAYTYCFPVIHGLAVLIPVFNFKLKSTPKLFFITRYFPGDYIIISGIRNYSAVLGLVYLPALLLSPLKLFPLAGLFICNMIYFSFYEVNESIQMLQSSGKTPKRFLAVMSYTAMFRLIVLNAPVLVINSLFHYDMAWVNVFFMLYSSLLLLTVIAMKYANISYYSKANPYQVKLLIMCLGLFMPYLMPLAIIFYLQSRTEALKNLKQYLHVTD